MPTTYRVTAPLVLVKDEAGAFGYFYFGAILPPYVKGDVAKGLVDEGLIAKSDAPAAATPAASEPPPAVPSPTGAPSERPAQVAPKEAWVAYAVSQGAAQDQAEAMTKAELVSTYGS